jgi:hypothetical protein
MTAKRKNSLARRVRRAYSQDELTRILTLPESEFGREFDMKTVEVEQRGWRADEEGGNDYYHFKDNGARVLAVAHLDTVVKPEYRVPRFYDSVSGPALVSGGLDDRLGAYVILKLLPAMGVTVDYLLTVGEEDGQSTADFFTSDKTYDHVIEFDRMGTDVVMYQYDDAATRKAVRTAGAVVGNGSFSDIAYLEQLGAKAFNWGVGYAGNYHSRDGYALLNNTFAMVAKYLRFHEQNAGVPMPHKPSPRRRHSRSYGGSREWRDGLDCDMCGQRGTVDMDTAICAECGTCFDCGEYEEDCICAISRIRREGYKLNDDGDAAYEQWLAEHATTVKDATVPTDDDRWIADTLAARNARESAGKA